MSAGDAPSKSAPAKHAALEPAALRRVRLVGAVTLLLIAIAAAYHAGRDGGPLAAQVFDMYQRLHPRPVTDSPVRIIAIDELSLLNHGAWPWPRNYLVALHEAALENGARVVGYDLIFPEPDRHGPSRLKMIYGSLGPETAALLDRLPDLDAYMADSIARLPVVVARVGMQHDENGRLGANQVALSATVTGALGQLHTFPFAMTNLPDIDDFAHGHGLLNGIPDEDGIVRRMLLLARVAGEGMPSLSAELLRVAQGADSIALAADGRAVQIGDLAVRTEPGAILRPWFSPPLNARYLSATDVLQGHFSPEDFRDRIVIIAPAALGLEDIVPTPVVGETYGVDLHAQAIEVMLSGDWLSRLPQVRAAEWLLLFLLGVGALAWLPRVGLTRGVTGLLAMVALLCASGWLLFTQAQILFDPTLPGLGVFATALIVFGMLSIETDKLSVKTERERARIEASLRQAQLEHARVDGELAAAREIQLGILPPANKLEDVPDAVYVSAFLEPAREIGGDLYDLFMLDDRHLFFVVGDVTGKGVPAALFMAICKALTGSAILHHNDALAEAIGVANRLISRENPATMFVTVLAGVLDCETGRLSLVNAGHDDPYLIRAGEAPRRIPCEGGPPLCFMEDYEYPLDATVLEPGDRVLILTDGVTEARNVAGELFGNERVERLLGTLPPQLGNYAMIQSLRMAVRDFEAGEAATDDMTLMMISYTPDYRREPGDEAGTAVTSGA